MGNPESKIEGFDCTFIGKLNALGIDRLHISANAADIKKKAQSLIASSMLIYIVAGEKFLGDTNEDRLSVLLAFRDQEHFHTAVVRIADSNITQGDDGYRLVQDIRKELLESDRDYASFATIMGSVGILSARYIRRFDDTYDKEAGGISMKLTLNFNWPHYHTFPLEIECHDYRDWTIVPSNIKSAMERVNNGKDIFNV